MQFTGVSTERGSLLFRKKDRIPRPPESYCLQMMIIVLFNQCAAVKSSTEKKHCKNKNQTKPLYL